MYINIVKDSFRVVGKEPIKIDFKYTPNRDRLFETIKIYNGKAYNLDYHQKRLDRAFLELFKRGSFSLKEALKGAPKDGLYRAKLIYNKDGLIDCSFFRYQKKQIFKIALVELSNIEYSYKYLDRAIFDMLYSKFDFDEFIITKDGYLRDTTIANIALLHKSGLWHTPKEPLLEGVTRQRYLESLKLIKKMIHYRNLNEYLKLATLNAMVDFNILEGK